MHIIKLILAVLTLSQVTQAAQMELLQAVNPGLMVQMHSRGILDKSNAAQNDNMENADFDFSTLTEHAMNTLHVSLQQRNMLGHCAALQGNVREKMNDAAEIGDNERILNLMGISRDLNAPIQTIEKFINDYPFIRNIRNKRETSRECFQSVIAINTLTFPFALNNIP